MNITIYLRNCSKAKENTIIILDIQNTKFTARLLSSNLYLKIQELVNTIDRIPFITYVLCKAIAIMVDIVDIKSKIYPNIIPKFIIPPLFINHHFHNI